MVRLAGTEVNIEARSVDEIKDIHDKAEAIRAYARKAGDLEFAWWATELKLDVDAFKTCFASGKFKKIVQQDAKEGGKIGVTGTPAFFVNGRFLSGAQPFESFKTIIDDELGR